MITDITPPINGKSVEDMTIEEQTEYKNCIAEIVNRLIKEECIKQDAKSEDGKIMIKINMKEPVWYKELDGQTKTLVFNNAKKYVLSRINALNFMEFESNEDLSKSIENSSFKIKESIEEID